MIKTPIGVAQFCDVPRAETHLHPGVTGTAALSCCFWAVTSMIAR